MTLPVNKIICGAMPEATRIYPDGYFNCCISSPPYWALRDYGVEGQLGLEPTFEEYIDKLCNIYDEVKRVLRDDGTCWVNLGDTYGGSGGDSGKTGPVRTTSGIDSRPLSMSTQGNQQSTKHLQKSLCLIPDRFAIEMVNRGWILRNVVIWHKPNPMPSSAKDRFTVDFEYVYFFTKRKKYWFEPQYEAHKNPEFINEKYGTLGEHNVFSSAEGNRSVKFGTKWSPNERAYNPLGRNKRTVWTIATQPFPEAHFATFPEKLVEPMIKAGCPEFVCKKCGKAREKMWDTVFVKKSDSTSRALELEKKGDRSVGLVSRQGTGNNEHTFKGYTDCGCKLKDKWRSGIVLDCFRWFGDCGLSSRPAAA